MPNFLFDFIFGKIFVMINTTAEKIESIAAAQAEWFRKSDRDDIGCRKEARRKLESALRKWQKPIEEALQVSESVCAGCVWNRAQQKSSSGI